MGESEGLSRQGRHSQPSQIRRGVRSADCQKWQGDCLPTLRTPTCTAATPVAVAISKLELLVLVRFYNDLTLWSYEATSMIKIHVHVNCCAVLNSSRSYLPLGNSTPSSTNSI